METQAVDNEFSKLKQEFCKVNNAATEQKLQNDATNLIEDILHEDNPFKNIDIEDRIFDNGDGQDIKDISKEITDVNGPFLT